jgi:methionine sulfoxide reductase heme-binding subunit
MRELARGAAIGLVAAALLGAIASRTGWAAIEAPRPDGPGAWWIARASGYAALVALALAAIAGLGMTARAGERLIARKSLAELHSWLSPLAIALVLGHALVLLADRYVGFDVIDVAVPLAARYRPVAVSLGIVAAYAAIVVHVSFGWRRRIGAAWWRRLHRLSAVSLIAAAAHAMAAGTDAARPWAIALVAAPLAIVTGLVAWRIARSRSRLRRVTDAA